MTGPTAPTSPRSALFVITGRGRGGAETQLVRLVTALVARGWRVAVLSLAGPNLFAEPLGRAGITVHSLDLQSKRQGLWALAKVRAVVRAIAPQVVVAFLYHAALAAVLGTVARHIPTIASMRNHNFGSPLRLASMGLLARLSRFHAVVANAHTTANQVAGAIPPHRLRVIPNALPPGFTPSSHLRGPTRAALGVAPPVFLWLAVGNLTAAKDYPNLLRAVHSLVCLGLPFRVCIAGAGAPHPAVRALLNRPAIGSRVQLLGPRNDIPALLAACDALVLSSRSEGLPNAVIEAACMARPVVATDVGGLRELVTHLHTGLLVPPSNSPALALAMARLMRMSANDRKTMGAAGERAVRARCDPTAVVDQWEQLMLGAMGGG